MDRLLLRENGGSSVDNPACGFTSNATRMEIICSCKEFNGKIGADRKVLLAGFINQMTASNFEINSTDLMQPDRGLANVTRARQVAMYLMHTGLSFTYVEIAAFYSRDRTTVRHACCVIEDLRDIPAFDEKLCELESVVEMVLRLCSAFAGDNQSG